MRAATLSALTLTVALAMFVRRGEASGQDRFVAAEDDEDFRPQYMYRDYGVIRRSVDDAFDDYGHLRFGRSDD